MSAKAETANGRTRRQAAIPVTVSDEPDVLEIADDVQGQLDEANDNTKAVLQVVEAVNRANTVEEAAKAALDTVKAAFGWAYASYWAVDPKDNVLRFSVESGSVNEEFRRVTMGASFREGEGLSGRAWKARDLFFTEDIGQMTDCCPDFV